MNSPITVPKRFCHLEPNRGNQAVNALFSNPEDAQLKLLKAETLATALESHPEWQKACNRSAMEYHSVNVGGVEITEKINALHIDQGTLVKKFASGELDLNGFIYGVAETVVKISDHLKIGKYDGFLLHTSTDDLLSATDLLG